MMEITDGCGLTIWRALTRHVDPAVGKPEHKHLCPVCGDHFLCHEVLCDQKFQHKCRQCVDWCGEE